MRAALLLGMNLVREQRAAVISLMLFGVGSALLYSGADLRQDHGIIAFYVKQQAGYAMLFGMFMGGSAVHNERRSRRILGVLSKGISRWQYMCGALMGMMMVEVAFAAVVLTGFAWMAGRVHVAVRGGMEVLALGLAGAVLVTCVSMLFATFLHPLIANIGTAILLFVPWVVHYKTGVSLARVMGLGELIQNMGKYEVRGAWSADWGLAGMALAQAVVFFTLAVVVFERKDIAVAVE